MRSKRAKGGNSRVRRPSTNMKEGLSASISITSTSWYSARRAGSVTPKTVSMITRSEMAWVLCCSRKARPGCQREVTSSAMARMVAP
jgi:hypothetical protein